MNLCVPFYISDCATINTIRLVDNYKQWCVFVLLNMYRGYFGLHNFIVKIEVLCEGQVSVRVRVSVSYSPADLILLFFLQLSSDPPRRTGKSAVAAATLFSPLAIQTSGTAEAPPQQECLPPRWSTL